MPLLFPPTRALGLGLSLASGALLATHSSPFSRRQRPLLQCESPLPSSGSGGSFRTYAEQAKEPVVKRDGRLNAAVVKQLSSGSLLGLIGGVAVSTFSKTLALVFGLLVSVIQFAAFKGYNIIPTARIQRYVKGINLRSALEDNVAFKLSFGTTFMLAAFVKLQ